MARLEDTYTHTEHDAGIFEREHDSHDFGVPDAWEIQPADPHRCAGPATCQVCSIVARASAEAARLRGEIR